MRCVCISDCVTPQGLSSYMVFFLPKDSWFSSSRTHADHSQTYENTSCLTRTLEFLLRSGKVQESALYRVPRCCCGSPGDTLQVTVRLHNSYPTGDSEILPQAYTQCCRWVFNMGGPIRMQEMGGEGACRNPEAARSLLWLTGNINTSVTAKLLKRFLAWPSKFWNEWEIYHEW